MKSYPFVLTLSGRSPLDDDMSDALYRAGCDDASFGERGRTAYASFDRDAATFRDAVTSAIRDVESVDGIRVERVEDEDLVSAAEIGTRTKRTRQNVWQLATGERGGGDFPAPAVQLDSQRSLWRWREVADWFSHRDGLPALDEDTPAILEHINSILKARNSWPALADTVNHGMVAVTGLVFAPNIQLTYEPTGQVSTTVKTSTSVGVTAGFTSYALAA